MIGIDDERTMEDVRPNNSSTSYYVRVLNQQVQNNA